MRYETNGMVVRVGHKDVALLAFVRRGQAAWVIEESLLDRTILEASFAQVASRPRCHLLPDAKVHEDTPDAVVVEVSDEQDALLDVELDVMWVAELACPRWPVGKALLPTPSHC